jgi:hypothetical protein
MNKTPATAEARPADVPGANKSAHTEENPKVAPKQ